MVVWITDNSIDIQLSLITDQHKKYIDKHWQIRYIISPRGIQIKTLSFENACGK